MANEREKSDSTPGICERQFQAIFMVMDEGVVVLGRGSEIVAVNPAAERILGVSAAELMGLATEQCVQVHNNFVTEDGAPLSPELHPAMLALRTGKPQRNVVVGTRRPDGTLSWLSINAQPMASDGEAGPYGVVATFRDVTESKCTEDALSFVAQRGWTDSNEKFFDALVQYLGKTLGVEHVLVSRLTEAPGVVETVAFYARGALAPNMRYGLAGTPCENVMGQKFCFYPQGIQQLFPEDAWLVETEASGYAGQPLWDSTGKPIGLIAVLDGKPLRDEAKLLQVMQIMATRAAAELERECNERRLRQSERDFRSLAENMPDNVVRHDRQARAQYMNPALMASVGPEALPVLGKSPIESHPGDGGAAGHQRMIEGVIATGTPAELEFEFPNPRGEMRFHHLYYVPERDCSGEIVGALGIGRDITAQRASERQLRQALEFTQGVISAIPDLLFEMDREGTYLSIWAQNPELLAAQKEVLLGSRVSDVLAPDAAEVVLAAIREADEKGMSFGKVLRIDLPQGESWFELSVSKKPGSDVPRRFIVLSRDITGRIRMEDDIRRRELEFRSLAENMPDRVIRYDRQTRVQYVNPALMANVAPEFLPVLGESVTQTYPGNEGAAWLERVVSQVIATGAPAEVEFEMANPQGKMRLNEVRYVAERDEHGEIIGVLGIGRDITEQRASELQLRQALEFTEGVINAIPDLLFEADRHGTCLTVWAGTPELLAMHKEALLGKTLAAVLAPDMAEVALSAIREADEKGLSFGKVLRVDIRQGPMWFELSVSKKPGSDPAGRFIVLSRNVTERKRMEDDIRRRELEFRSLAENIPDNVVRYDRRARAVYMNPALMASVAPHFLPVLGQSPIETYPGKEGAAGHQRIVEQVVATGMPAEWEFQTWDVQGRVRIHHARYVAERDSHGQIVGVLGLGRDITERKLAEEYEQFRSRTLELLAGGAPLQEVLEGIVRGVEQLKPDMICSVLLLDGEGKRLTNGIAPSLPDFYNAAVDGLEVGIGVGCCGTVAATGERVIVDDLMSHPYWAPYKDLAARAGLAACWSEPVRSSTGQVLGTFAVYHREVYAPAAVDISIVEKSTRLISIAIERAQAEEALRASEREFRTLAENMPEPLVRYDREGRRIYVSPVLEREFAVAAESMIGKTLPETNPTGMLMPEVYQRALEHTLATGERSEFELRIAPIGRDVHTYLCFMVAERAEDGRISGAIAMSRDITERKRSEAELEQHRRHLERMVEERTRDLLIAKETAEAATHAKSRFLAAASHDLRQPISAIVLYNDALALGGLSEEQQKVSRSLTRAVNSLGEMLNELLDVAKLDAGKLVPEPAVIQSAELLETIASEFDSLAREKHLSFNCYWPRRNLELFTDRKLLMTVLRNLIGNAIKYTERGGILVGIRRRGNRALIQVWDTGMGIAHEHLGLIFEEYFQANNSERNRAKGAGLGLAIVKRVGEALGSRVSCRSRLGRGSVFEISLPLAQSAGAQLVPAQACATHVVSALGRLAGRRIVIVEDDELAATALKLLLETHGVRVTLFGNAEDVLGSMEAMAADHYISDYNLRDMNGWQLLDAIQAKAAKPIKAVLLTGNTSLDQTQSSRWKVLFKPVSVPALLSALALEE